jgi:hypothetical protein
MSKPSSSSPEEVGNASSDRHGWWMTAVTLLAGRVLASCRAPGRACGRLHVRRRSGHSAGGCRARLRPPAVATARSYQRIDGCVGSEMRLRQPTPLCRSRRARPTARCRVAPSGTVESSACAGSHDPLPGMPWNPDPLDGVDGTTTVANPWHYADNNPLNKVDPLGLRPCDRSMRELSTSFVTLGLDGSSTGECDPAHLDRTLACFGSYPGYSAPWNPTDEYSITWAEVYWDLDGGWDGYLGVINHCVAGHSQPTSSAWALVDTFSPEQIVRQGDVLRVPCDPGDVPCELWALAADLPLEAAAAGFAFVNFKPTPRPLVCRSFSADTAVLLAEGETKPISEIEIGDMVLATDPETGETAAREVTAVWVMPHDGDLLDVTISGPDGTEGVVETTDGHKFWSVTVEDWVEAQHLTEGEALRQPAGTTATVVTITPQAGQADMWDLTIAIDHTFYVTYGDEADEAVLVHNCGVGSQVHRIHYSPNGPVHGGGTVKSTDRGVVHLDNFSIYGQRGGQVRPDAHVALGNEGVIGLRAEVSSWARSQGFSRVRITGIRDGGANPGRRFDYSWDT